MADRLDLDVLSPAAAKMPAKLAVDCQRRRPNAYDSIGSDEPYPRSTVALVPCDADECTGELAEAIVAVLNAAPRLIEIARAAETVTRVYRGGSDIQEAASALDELCRAIDGTDLTVHPCHREGCDGALKLVISDDGSAVEATRCEKCGASWWFDPPPRNTGGTDG